MCGGYQLLGHSYELGPGEELPGVELLDVRTVRADGPRLIGNVAIEVSLDDGDKRVLAGFENHGGRTHLGAGQAPLGRVLDGLWQRRAQRLRGRALLATCSAPTCTGLCCRRTSGSRIG